MKQDFVMRAVDGPPAEIRFALSAPDHVEIAGATHPLRILRRDANGFVTALLGERVIHGFIERNNGDLIVNVAGRTRRFSLRGAALDSMQQGLLRAAAQNGTIELKNPIPGLIKAVRVQANASVSAGETLAILEAMKMENEIRAPHAGIVERICVAVGQNVAAGTVLFAIRTT